MVEALARIAARDSALARSADHAYEALTWGEGPGVLRQAGLQFWLWYAVPTKYITDEAGYMGRLARRATGRAMEKSGIDPPDLADFAWSDFMGGEESSAHSVVEDALERAIAAGDVLVGSRGWRVAQAAVANRLLHPVEPPSGAYAAVAPLVWLLDRHGEEQPLTQAGYLTPAFVRSLQAERPWELKLPMDRQMRTEGDDVVLLALREWLQHAGALRKRKSKLLRTSAGAAMAADPPQSWSALTRHLAPRGWDGFAAETVLLHLLDSAGRDSQASYDSVLEFAAVVAEDMGWTTSDGGERRAPSDSDVAWALFDIRQVWEVCGLVTFEGDWQDRRFTLTGVGEAAALSYLRHVAAGPRTSLQ